MENVIVSSGSVFPGGTIGSGVTITINAGASADPTNLSGGQETDFGQVSVTTVQQTGFLTVSSGGTAIDTTVGNAGEVVVGSSGTASSTVVESGGVFALNGTADGMTVADGGIALINPGAKASSIVVDSCGLLVLSATTADKHATDFSLAAGGTAIVLPGPGKVDGITGAGNVVSTGVVDVALGGGGIIEYVLSGGVVSGSTVGAGRSQQIFSGGTAIAETLNQSFQVVNRGATASGTTIEQGAVEYVYSGGKAVDSIVNAGFALVNSGGLAIGLTVNSGGVDSIDGVVSDTTVNAGGDEYVVAGGTAIATTVSNGGSDYVWGSARATLVLGGGFDEVQSGGAATDVTVGSGGVLFANSGQQNIAGFFSGAIVSSATIQSGGIEVVFSGATDIGSRIEAGGTYIALPGAMATPNAEIGADIVASGVVAISGSEVTLYSSSLLNAVVSSGTSDYVLNHGTVISATIGNHGFSEIAAGGSAIDTTISGGGELQIDNGGIAAGSIQFAGSGGTLIANATATLDAVVSGFYAGDTIDLSGFTTNGGSISSNLLPGNTLVVTNGSLSQTIEFDPMAQYASGAFSVVQGDNGAVVTVSTPQPTQTTSPAAASAATSPVDIPLYVLPFETGYKIGIEVSLDGGASYQMYEFDTGGTGFYTSYSPTAWSSYTPVDTAPVVNYYASKNVYVSQVVSTDVTFQTTNGGTISVDNADVGLIATGYNLDGTITTQGWNSDLTDTPSQPPLQTSFYGDFGMALDTANGLYAILPQIGDGLSNGFIINVGSYPNGVLGQIGDLQVGLTQADIESFPTLISMAGANLLDTFPNSGLPSYAEGLIDGAVAIAGSAGTFDTPTNFVLDTGTPTMRIYEGTTITPDDLAPFLNGDTFIPGSTITSTAPDTSQGDSTWLSFVTNLMSGLNEVNSSTPSTSREGAVNTGLNAFFGYRIMFDLADGLVGIESIACFAAGTHLLTQRGEVAIDLLQADDRLLTIDGQLRPIAWIGHRTVDCQRHPSPQDVRPVCVRAHAFGPGVPHRDLYLSPDHALYLQNVLIPVRYLVDGVNIMRIERDTVTYYHVELDRHDVILAENLPAETYLETGNRAAFINGGQVVQARPNFAASPFHWEARGYAPLIVAGPIVEGVRQQLQQIAVGMERDDPNDALKPARAG